uniref:Uncharacterized protein n=1 Tax=Avena sativa TaxID=4498 RepID=A0ACD6ANF9_AVESA
MGVSARLFLPSYSVKETGRRLPLILYFHGGAFCTGSAFSLLFHRYAASLSAGTGALIVSVDYGLAPERPIPAAYDDAWAALLWAYSSSDPWIASYADPACTFLAGESAGANIAHNVALRAGKGIAIKGLILLHPFFWGSERLPCETDHGRHDVPMFALDRVDALWPFVTAGTASNDDPRVNPPSEQIVSLQCQRVLVGVAGKDVFRDRGRRYVAELRDGAWSGEVTLIESEGEDHCFHLHRPSRASATTLMDHVVQFVNQRTTTSAGTIAMTPSQFNTSDGDQGKIRASGVVRAQILVSSNGRQPCKAFVSARRMSRNASKFIPAQVPVVPLRTGRFYISRV